MKTVGIDTINRSRSAIERLIKNKFVEFLRYFVLITTNGTKKFPLTPMVNMIKHATVAMILIYRGKLTLSSPALVAAGPSLSILVTVEFIRVAASNGFEFDLSEPENVELMIDDTDRLLTISPVN